MEQNTSQNPSHLSARSPLLLIDDNEVNLRLLERMLEWAGYFNLQCCTNAAEGLSLVKTFRPDLVILDLMMPGMSGYEFLSSFREGMPDTSFLPVLVFTADLSSEARTRALELGASDFLTKPGDALEIQLRVQNFLRMRRMHAEIQRQNELLEAKVRQRTEHLLIARQETVEVLADACEYRDDLTGQHVRRVGELSAGIAAKLYLEDEFIQNIRLAAPLHDLGKLGIPDDILHKPGQLTPEETEVMRQHVRLGAKLLADKTSPLLELAREIAQYHHEHWNGQGYEEGLSGEAIPLSARIVAVADAFDAMTTDRPYRAGRSRQEAIQELLTASGTQFDPKVVQALLAHFSDERINKARAA